MFLVSGIRPSGAGVAAIISDNIGFWIGDKGGYRLARRYGSKVRLDERKLKTARYLFDLHGVKVVFFGRFVSVLRTHAAFLAGTSRITTAYSIEGGTVQSNDSIVLKEVGGPFGIVAGSYHTRAGKQGFYLGYSPPGLHSAFGIGFDLGSVKMLLGPFLPAEGNPFFDPNTWRRRQADPCGHEHRQRPVGQAGGPARPAGLAFLFLPRPISGLGRPKPVGANGG